MKRALQNRPCILYFFRSLVGATLPLVQVWCSLLITFALLDAVRQACYYTKKCLPVWRLIWDGAWSFRVELGSFLLVCNEGWKTHGEWKQLWISKWSTEYHSYIYLVDQLDWFLLLERLYLLSGRWVNVTLGQRTLQTGGEINSACPATKLAQCAHSIRFVCNSTCQAAWLF